MSKAVRSGLAERLFCCAAVFGVDGLAQKARGSAGA